jgi:predicted RNase H-like HicB family nuclease
MKVREAIKLIEAEGWYLARTRGSHRNISIRPSAGWHREQYSQAGRTEMSRYLIIIEETSTGYSAYSPDLPGCVATGGTRDEVEAEMHDTIEFHIEGLRLAGETVPGPRSLATYCEVAA